MKLNVEEAIGTLASLSTPAPITLKWRGMMRPASIEIAASQLRRRLLVGVVATVTVRSMSATSAADLFGLARQSGTQMTHRNRLGGCGRLRRRLGRLMLSKSG